MFSLLEEKHGKKGGEITVPAKMKDEASSPIFMQFESQLFGNNLKLHNKSQRRQYTYIVIRQNERNRVAAVLLNGLAIGRQKSRIAFISPEGVLRYPRIFRQVPVLNIQVEVEGESPEIPFLIDADIGSVKCS